MDLQLLFPTIFELLAEAGEAIVAYRNEQKLVVSYKKDKSPCSTADCVSQQIIVDGIEKLLPGVPVIAEESINDDFSVRKSWETCWLIDPLDGTRSYLNNSDEFVINLALIQNHKSILGFIYVPIKKTFYYASKGCGVYKKIVHAEPQQIYGKKINWNNLQLLTGRFNRSKTLEKLALKQSVHIQQANSALKFGWLAEGRADIYPRLGPTQEWDSAAGHCLLQEVGGTVVDLNGEPLQYNAKPSLLNPSFLAMSDASELEKILKIFNA